jgi:hypothetical protein
MVTLIEGVELSYVQQVGSERAYVVRYDVYHRSWRLASLALRVNKAFIPRIINVHVRVPWMYFR